MSRFHTHAERHAFERIGWLRAAVLGANDGIVSTASLILGVAAAEASRGSVLTAGIAALVGGAMSMAAGEYVSVSSQSDTEKADMARETRELEEDPGAELEELQGIYVQRGLDPVLALEVARQLTAKDPLRHTCATNSAFPKSMRPVRSRPPSPPQPLSRLAPPCPC